MIVMPACSTGWFWHCLARETGRIGHLLSPGNQRGPWPWFPYALDNGAFSCWDMKANRFDDGRWASMETQWRLLAVWAASQTQRPMWAIVPDVPGNAERTIEAWARYAPVLVEMGIPTAVAVQDGMTKFDVWRLTPAPEVVCVGGTTEWKWATAEGWLYEFPRVHLLRCNSPEKLKWLEQRGCESCDGTGWNRGDRTQTGGLEAWARSGATPVNHPLTPFASRATCKRQTVFA